MNTRLIAKGSHEDRAALAQEGKVHVGLGRTYERELAAAGWSKARTNDLESGVAALESNEAIQSDTRQAKSTAGAAELTAVIEVKSVIRKVRNVWPMVVRDNPGAGVTLDAIHAGEKLGRSTPRIAAYVTRVLPHVAKLDGPLAQYFAGQKASELLAARKKALDGADAAQEVAVKSAPQATLAVYEQKGRVLELIEDMNAVAKNAFDGNAALIAKFNKDILNRGRRAAAGLPTPPPPAPAPGGPQAAK